MASKTRVRSGRGLVVAAMCAAVVMTACGSSGGGSSAADKTSPLGTGAATTTATTTPAPPGSGSGTPARKACDLLTKDIAETALGVPVAPAKQTPGQANETCSYRVADKSSVATVFLTTYAAKGTEALLDAAAAQFTKAYAVDGVGDAARVSLEDHAIGVLKGDVVIAIGLIPPSNGTDIAPVTEEQLVNVAKAVVPAM